MPPFEKLAEGACECADSFLRVRLEGSDRRGKTGEFVMKKRNPRLGSTLESWLEEEGIREEVTAAAVKAVLAAQLAAEMRKKRITKKRMAELMNTSRAQVDRVLDPDNGAATLDALMRAAHVVGCSLHMRLV